SAPGGTFVWKGGTLANVTYNGVLDLSATGASVTIAGGLTAHDASGVGDGTINLTGSQGRLQINDSQTLDHATINIGDTDVLSSVDTGAGSATLTLGAHLTINNTAGFAYISNAGKSGDTIVNQGTIAGSAAGGRVTITSYDFVNQGALE